MKDKIRTEYQEIKDLGLNVSMITRILSEANILNRKGEHFPKRTIQLYFDKNFIGNTLVAQEDMDLVLEKVENIKKNYLESIKKLK